MRGSARNLVHKRNEQIKIKSITKNELLRELEPFIGDAEIVINIGTENYPIDCVISGGGKIFLESNSIITPAIMGQKSRKNRTRKYKNKQEKVDFHNAKRKKENQNLSDQEILAKIRGK